MNVLVLDPADSTGYALVKIKDDLADIYEYGFLEVGEHEYDGDRCIDLMEQIRSIMLEHSVEKVAVEDYFFSGKFASGCNMNAAYRTAIHILCRQLKLEYTILNISLWKKFVSGRTTPTKYQKEQWGKVPAKKLMIQQALWEKYGFRFPNHSLSKKTGKPIKFRYDIVDAVAQAIFFCRLHLDIRDVQLSMNIPPDVEIKRKSKSHFIYPEE